jgi:predicted nucleic acid-binding protein
VRGPATRTIAYCRNSLYVALAVTLKTELITADEKLANALAGYFPVKWLGEI